MARWPESAWQRFHWVALENMKKVIDFGLLTVHSVFKSFPAGKPETKMTIKFLIFFSLGTFSTFSVILHIYYLQINPPKAALLEFNM